MVIHQARKNLIDFAIAVNPKYKPNWHHEIIASELENIEKHGDRDYKVLLIFVPPRHGKSELCSILFPAWYLGRNKDKEIITVSYSADLAQDFGSKTRSLIDDEAYKHIFDVSLKADEKAKAKWKTDKDGSYTSVGIGGTITGRGANVLLFDDPIKNREEAESEVYRKKIWEFFTSTAFTRLEPNAVVVVILTRWHIDDLAGRILENEELKDRCRVIHFPAVANENEQHRKIGEALWIDRFPSKVLSEIKGTIGPYDWTALYQGSPILTEKQEFKPEWYKYITEKELSMLSTNKYLTIDTAISKRTQADYTGFCDNEVDRENFWNLRAWRAKINADELTDTLFTLQEKRKYVSIGIEKTAYLDGLKPFIDMEQRKRDRFLPIVELKHHQTSKEIRIRGLVPRYSSGSVKHLEGECGALEEEQFNFPFGNKDDVLDAVAYQMQIAKEVPQMIPNYRVSSTPKKNPAR